MNILSAVSSFVRDYSRARSRHQTERQIRSLPLEVQKDIGWPDAVRREVTISRFSLGAWGGER